MKILYVAASPVPSRAANSVHVVKMAQALSKNGHEVELYVPIPIAQKKEILGNDIFGSYGVDRIFKFTQGLLYPSKVGVFLFSFSAYLRATMSGADFVFTRCLPTAALMAALRMPVLYERHSDFGEGRQLNRLMYKFLAKSKFHLGTVVVSEALKQFFIEDFGLEEHKLIAAADGSDPIPEGTYKCPFAKKDGRKAAGYIGHLYKGRGIDIIADVAKTHPECDFHIVGGNDEDLSYWKEEMKTVPNMIFHGYVSHSETKNYMMSFDILLAPYQKKVEVAGGGNTERWMSPLKIFEYMSSGKPLICSDMPVLREVLHSGENCLLCPPDNVAEWEKALGILINNPELASKIGNQAKDDFLKNYTWEIRAKKILDVVFGR